MINASDVKADLEVHLRRDSDLARLINGVYDYVPPRATLPFITLGEASGQDNSSQTHQGLIVTQSLHVWWGRERSDEGRAIIHRLQDLLHRQPLPLSAGQWVDSQLLSSMDFADEDGEAQHGVLRFIFSVCEAA